MNFLEFKNSDLFNKIVEMCVKEDQEKVDDVLNSFHLSKEEREELLRQIKLYHDELFYHSAMYEISGFEEVPTVERIMDMFDVCLFIASFLLEEYLEMI